MKDNALLIINAATAGFKEDTRIWSTIWNRWSANPAPWPGANHLSSGGKGALARQL